jgi:hypothetical protein
MMMTCLRWLPLASLLLVAIGCSDDGAPPAEAGVDATSDTVVADGATDDAGGSDDATGDDAAADIGGGGDDAEPDAANLGYPMPAAYWSMDSADITGDTINDVVGSSHGTSHGTVEAQGGQVGEARQLDGTDDYIDFDDVLSSIFSGADKTFSIAMWVKPASLGKAGALLVKNGDNACTPGENQRAFMTTISSSDKVGFAFQRLTPGSPQIVTTDAPLAAAGAWVHLLFVYDGSIDSAPEDRVTIYVNGANQSVSGAGMGTFPLDIGVSTAHLGFGVRLSSDGSPCPDAGGGVSFFGGMVDELAVWPVALTAIETAAVYGAGAGGKRLVPAS